MNTRTTKSKPQTAFTTPDTSSLDLSTSRKTPDVKPGMQCHQQGQDRTNQLVCYVAPSPLLAELVGIPKPPTKGVITRLCKSKDELREEPLQRVDNLSS